MKTRVGVAVLLALAAAGGCTKQTAGTSNTPGTASTPESTIIQQATQTPATMAALPMEPAPAASMPMEPATAAAPAAPMDTTAESGAGAKVGSAQNIQQALKQAGFYQGAVDGKIGPKTQQAIKAFQQAHQLKVDGKVGPKTWAALQAHASAASLSATSGQ